MARASHIHTARPVSAPTAHEDLSRAIDELVDECRVESLWYFRPDYYPRTDLERQQVLDAIQERCSRDVFQRAGILKVWLSRHSRICFLLAEQRKQGGESYVAGGDELNEALGGTRKSRDVDLISIAEALITERSTESPEPRERGRADLSP